jgi:hypothetical protein
MMAIEPNGSLPSNDCTSSPSAVVAELALLACQWMQVAVLRPLD